MRAIATAIPDVQLLEPRVFSDERGFFFESYNHARFAEFGITDPFVQDNHSRSTKGVLRGLHYQVERPQGKLVRVVQGSIFDVAVDLRRSSSTFGKWVGFELSDVNQLTLWVPPGFAHGFVALSASVDFLYKCTNLYEPSLERSIRWNDSDLAIAWPTPIVPPIVSARDEVAPLFRSAEYFT